MKQTSNFFKAGLLALFICLTAMISWEIHLRNIGAPASYDDNEPLWSDKRAMVYEPKDKATVIAGSSRIKFDLDIPTWQNLTGDHAIQLSNVGSSPRPVLMDLANDENFKGKLIIDVTEGVFFSATALYDWKTRNKIAYYKVRTPTQRFSFQVDRVLESQFVFLDQEFYSINSMLDNLTFFPRPGIYSGNPFPMEFHPVSFDRQSYMTSRFVSDTSLRNQVKAVWTRPGRNLTPPVSGSALDSILNSVKFLVDKIEARGGEVIFVRTPSSGPVLKGEMKRFPRAEYWDRLLTVTGCKGIHFADYPAIANFDCPEWSHLSPDQAVIFTTQLIKIIQEDIGWTFNKNPA
jgi:hypothetical protein